VKIPALDRDSLKTGTPSNPQAFLIVPSEVFFLILAAYSAAQTGFYSGGLSLGIAVWTPLLQFVSNLHLIFHPDFNSLRAFLPVLPFGYPKVG
jgi:hypothetical protein